MTSRCGWSTAALKAGLVLAHAGPAKVECTEERKAELRRALEHS